MKDEVLTPRVNPGMKQRCQPARLRIDTGNIGSLVSIAVYAGEGQIFRNVPTSMLLRNHMIDLKRRGMSGRRQQAVLTSASRTFPNALDHTGNHLLQTWRGAVETIRKARRAWDCIIARRLLTWM